MQPNANRSTVQPSVQPSPLPQDNDISKTTITVLVLLTLIISVIGTWTVLNELNTVKVTKSSTATGTVSLNIRAPPGEPVTDGATGRVTLNILENRG